MLKLLEICPSVHVRNQYSLITLETHTKIHSCYVKQRWYSQDSYSP